MIISSICQVLKETQSEYEEKEIKYDVFMKMLEWIYTGELDLSVGIENLEEAAKKYHLASLITLLFTCKQSNITDGIVTSTVVDFILEIQVLKHLDQNLVEALICC